MPTGGCTTDLMKEGLWSEPPPGPLLLSQKLKGAYWGGEGKRGVTISCTKKLHLQEMINAEAKKGIVSTPYGKKVKEDRMESEGCDLHRGYRPWVSL